MNPRLSWHEELPGMDIVKYIVTERLLIINLTSLGEFTQTSI